MPASLLRRRSSRVTRSRRRERRRTSILRRNATYTWDLGWRHDHRNLETFANIDTKDHLGRGRITVKGSCDGRQTSLGQMADCSAQFHGSGPSSRRPSVCSAKPVHGKIRATRPRSPRAASARQNRPSDLQLQLDGLVSVSGSTSTATSIHDRCGLLARSRSTCKRLLTTRGQTAIADDHRHCPRATGHFLPSPKDDQPLLGQLLIGMQKASDPVSDNEAKACLDDVATQTCRRNAGCEGSPLCGQRSQQRGRWAPKKGR